MNIPYVQLFDLWWACSPTTKFVVGWRGRNKKLNPLTRGTAHGVARRILLSFHISEGCIIVSSLQNYFYWIDLEKVCVHFKPP